MKYINLSTFITWVKYFVLDLVTRKLDLQLLSIVTMISCLNVSTSLASLYDLQLLLVIIYL